MLIRWGACTIGLSLAFRYQSTSAFVPPTFGQRRKPSVPTTRIATAATAPAAAALQGELEWDEDDFQPTARTLDDYLEQFDELARVTSKDPNAVDRATALFDDLYQTYLTTEDMSFWPTTAIYNKLLEIHAFSNQKDGAEQATLILNRLRNENSDVVLPPPDRQSFALVMVAWMRRDRLDEVEALWNEMMDSDNPDLIPNIYIYNKVIQARGMAGLAEEAEELLEELLQAAAEEGETETSCDDYENEYENKILNPTMVPNQKTWVQVMRAYASPEHAKNGGVAKIKELMGRMAKGFRTEGYNDWNPRIEAYDALLFALSHNKGSAREAENILYQLIAQCREGQKEMCPTNSSFYYVLRAYQNDSERGTAFKVEKLLELQDALASQEPSLKPTAKVLSAAMAAISRAQDSNKAVKAQRILERLKEDAAENSDALTIFPFKSLMNACAYTVGTPEDKLAAFQIAVDTLNEIRSSPELKVNSSIFGLFLRACGKLMPPTKKRDAVIDNVFRMCCNDGCLNDYVLKEFKNAASEALQLKILGGFLEDGVHIPDEWSRNAESKSKRRSR